MTGPTNRKRSNIRKQNGFDTILYVYELDNHTLHKEKKKKQNEDKSRRSSNWCLSCIRELWTRESHL